MSSYSKHSHSRSQEAVLL